MTIADLYNQIEDIARRIGRPTVRELLHDDDAVYIDWKDECRAQRELDAGTDPAEIRRKLRSWADDTRQEAAEDAAVYANTVGYYDNVD